MDKKITLYIPLIEILFHPNPSPHQTRSALSTAAIACVRMPRLRISSWCSPRLPRSIFEKNIFDHKSSIMRGSCPINMGMKWSRMSDTISFCVISSSPPNASPMKPSSVCTRVTSVLRLTMRYVPPSNGLSSLRCNGITSIFDIFIFPAFSLSAIS